MTDTYNVSCAYKDTDGELYIKRKSFYAATAADALLNAKGHFATALPGIADKDKIYSEAKPELPKTSHRDRMVQVNYGNARGMQIVTGNGNVVTGDQVGGDFFIGDKYV